MTHKEENIVNIAMKAAELLKDGKIELDDTLGHTGLTEEIIHMADAFEKRNAGVNFDAEGRDYWLEIDAFAEEHLLERYSCEKAPESVLETKNVDSSLWDREEYPVSVYAVSSGGTKHKVYSGDLDDCKLFCENNEWSYKDENDFVWDLELEDSRADLLPEDYFMALDYYSGEVGHDIENEFVRQHAEELVYCFHEKKGFVDFDYWTEYETLLGEKISYEEYVAIDDDSPNYPSEIDPADLETIGALRQSLAEFRNRDPHLFTCLGDKQFMFLVKAVDLKDAEKTGEKWYTKTFFEPGRFDCWNTKKEDYAELDSQDVIESKAYQALAQKPSLAAQILSADNRQKVVAEIVHGKAPQDHGR